MSAADVEIRAPRGPSRRVTVGAPVDVGREGNGIVVDDDRVSRRHLRLEVVDGALTATDLGSTNGTRVNGATITTPTVLRPGDVVTIGGTEIVALPVDTGPAAAPGRPQVRPALGALEARDVGVAVIRYRPGSAGAAVARATGAAARKARDRLRGIGSEATGTVPQICLVDPFPDPDEPGRVIAGGTWIDPGAGEVWMVVTAESPPEPLERPLALVFGAGLPAGDDLAPLLEGYGSLQSDLPDPDPELRGRPLPALATAEGEERAAMLLSFVKFLVDKYSRKSFLDLLASARPNAMDAAFQQAYGQPMGSLEEEWKRKLAGAAERLKTGQFLRLTARYLRPHAWREGEMFVHMLLGMVFTIVFAKVFQSLIDTQIPSGEFSKVVGVLVILMVAFAISLLAGLRRAYLAAYIGSAIVRQVRTEMFVRLQTLSAGWFNRHQEGDILSRLFGDVYVLEQGLSQTMREGLFQMLSVVVFSITLFTISVPLAAITVLGAPLVALVYKAMSKGAVKRSMAVQEQTGQTYSVANENYGAQSVVKSFALEERERRRFERSSERLFKSEVRMQVFGGLFGLSVNMIVTFLRLVTLGLGAYLIIEGDYTIGGLAAFMSLMGEVLQPVTGLTQLGQQVQEATGALVRIDEVLQAVPEVADGPDARAIGPLRDQIRFAGVSFSYSPDRRTLDDIDLTIAAGSRVAFVGPTGSGKSSTLQLLLRFYDPEDGAVLFDGRDLRECTVDSVRGQIGVVFQETFLFDTTIRENIALGKDGATEEEIEAAARAAELHDFIETLPQRYDSVVGERGGRLSGGQKQRLAIARALVRDPTILVLDEATSALDPRTERLISDTLEKVASGRTTVAVTHRLTSVTDYDRIFVIVEGKIVEQGSHDELVARGGTYAQLWAEQTGATPPSEIPFDASAALARIPLFDALDADQLASIEPRLRAMDLAAGEQVPDGGGRVLIVRRGRARVLARGLDGRLAPVADLGSGDAFGVAALLGDDSGTMLEAVDATSLLVLDDEAIAGLAAVFPTVAAALTGSEPRPVAPGGGRRLSRMTIAPASRLRPVEADTLPSAVEEARRASGGFPALRP
jgi:ABC-type multidrug transport system fused ATPase/permease subunit